MSSDRVERRTMAARKERRNASGPYAVSALAAGGQPEALQEAVGPQEALENRVIDFLRFMYRELKEDEKEKFTLFGQLLNATDEHPLQKVAECAPGIIESQVEAIFSEYPPVVAAFKALVHGSNMDARLVVKAMVHLTAEYKIMA